MSTAPPGYCWREGLDVPPEAAAGILAPAYEPYWSRLLPLPDEAKLSILIAWSNRPTSEFYRGGGRFLADGSGAIAGGYLMFPGPDGRARRRADFLDLVMRFGSAGWLERLKRVAASFPALPEDDDFALFSKLAVAPGLRGTGVGSAMIGDVLERAEAMAPRVRLEVAASNVRAWRLYERMGFVKVAGPADAGVEEPYFAYERRFR